MKTLFSLGFCALTVLAGWQTSLAGLVNGSFESWNLHGWTLDNPQGAIAQEPFSRTAGAARTVSSWGDAFGFEPRPPAVGYRYLGINTRANANFIGDQTYNIVVSQSVAMDLGELLSGWSFFFSTDTEPQDSAWVRILDQNGLQLAQPWLETSGVASPEPTAATFELPTAWSLWQWEAPVAGVYTIQLGMTTSGNNNAASYGFFDGMTIEPATVIPEPGSLALAVTGAILFAGLRRRSK